MGGNVLVKIQVLKAEYRSNSFLVTLGPFWQYSDQAIKLVADTSRQGDFPLDTPGPVGAGKGEIACELAVAIKQLAPSRWLAGWLGWMIKLAKMRNNTQKMFMRRMDFLAKVPTDRFLFTGVTFTQMAVA